jgi:formate hydrogenlyase subunit 3/multisubunit Na+/H+ antiporter MnhD subunit
MNFSVVLELATFVAFAVVLLGGRSNRDNGWKMCVGLLGVVVVCQIAAMGIVVSFLHSLCLYRKREKLTINTGFPVRP